MSANTDPFEGWKPLSRDRQGDSINYYTTNVKTDSDQVNTGLIELEDDILVEVKMPEYKAGEFSRGRALKTLSRFSQIEAMLRAVAKPVISAAKRISETEGVSVNAEVEIGISFESEGNIYFTKNMAGANLVVKLSITSNK